MHELVRLRKELNEAVRLLRCLLLSADAEWMEGTKGHDWSNAVKEAEIFLFLASVKEVKP